MVESSGISFDLDNFLDNISLSSKDGDRKTDKVSKNIKLAKEMISKASHLGKAKYMNKWKLYDTENELAKLTKQYSQLLDKHMPLQQKLQCAETKIEELRTAHANSQTKSEALQSLNDQLQALVKELEEKVEALSVEKSLMASSNSSLKTNATFLKHIILFGKLASKKGKLSTKHRNLFNKYLREAGECEISADTDIKDFDCKDMPPSCGSLDTGIGSSHTSDDEKLWSPEALFSLSTTYEEAIPVTVENDLESFQDEIIPFIEKESSLNLPLIETTIMCSPTRSTPPDSPRNKHIATSPHKSLSEFSLHQSNVLQECPRKKDVATSSDKSLSDLSVYNSNDLQKYPKKHVATSPHKPWSEVVTIKNKKVSSVSTNTKNKKMCNVSTSPIKESSNQKNYFSEACDIEIDNILKEMSIENLTQISPIPPTPVNIYLNKKKKILYRRRNIVKSTTIFNIAEEVKKLQIQNYKLNKKLCQQRKQLLTTNRMLLKSYKIGCDRLTDNKSDFSKLLDFMESFKSKIGVECNKNNTTHNSDIGTLLNNKSSSKSEINNDTAELLTIVKKTQGKKSRFNNLFGDEETAESFENHENSQNLQDSISKVNDEDETSFTNNSHLQESISENKVDENMNNNVIKRKKQKLSKIEKLRKCLLQKPKIPCEDDILKRKKNNPVLKPIIFDTPSRSMSSSKELNKKEVYDKAVEYMTKMKTAASKTDSPQVRVTRSRICISDKLLLGENTNTGNKIYNSLNYDTSTDINQLSIPAGNDFEKPDKDSSYSESPTKTKKTLRSSNSTESNYACNKFEELAQKNTPRRILRSNVKSLDGIENTDTDIQSPKKFSIELVPRITRLSLESLLKCQKTSIESEALLKDYNDLTIFECDDNPLSRTSQRIPQSPGRRQESCSNTNSPEKTIRKLRSSNLSLDEPPVNNEESSSAMLYSRKLRKRKNNLLSDSECKVKKNCLDKTNDKESDQLLAPEHTPLNKKLEKISNQCCKLQKHRKYQTNEFFKSLICKYGRIGKRKTVPPNFPAYSVNQIHKCLEESLGDINEVPSSEDLNTVVRRIENKSFKHFIVGLLEFLMSELRTNDKLVKSNCVGVPSMTKQEQALLYILSTLQVKWSHVPLFEKVLKYIEYKILRLGITPDFIQIDNLSRFYAVLCRFKHSKHVLRMFMVEALYCLNYKALPLIKQCLDVWMHALPLGHMAQAQSPIVLVLVYAVFYFKTDDKKPSFHINALKKVLSFKYSYNMKDMSEKDILSKLKSYIVDIRDTKHEKKVIATALILIAKRKGVKWCQKHIVEEILMPMVNSTSTRDCVKAFCITLLGSLLKPYPDNMKLHTEMVVQKLLTIKDENSSFAVEQAIILTMVLLRRHNVARVLNILMTWTPNGQVCSELMDQLKIMIQEQPLNHWLSLLHQKKIQNTSN